MAFTEDSYRKDILEGPYLYIPVQIMALLAEGVLWEAHTEGPFMGAL